MKYFLQIKSAVYGVYNLVKSIALPVIVLIVTLLSLVVIKSWSGGTSKVADQMQAEMNAQHERFSAQLAVSSKTVIEFQERVVSAEKKSQELQEAFEVNQRELTNTQRALKETQRALTQAIEAVRKARSENSMLQRRFNDFAISRQAMSDSADKVVLPTADQSPKLETPRDRKSVSALSQIENDLEKVRSAWDQNYRSYSATWTSYVALQLAIFEAERSIFKLESPGKVVSPASFIPPTSPLPPKYIPNQNQQIVVPGIGVRRVDLEKLSDDEVARRTVESSDALVEAQTGLEKIIQAIHDTNSSIVADQARLKMMEQKLTSLIQQ